MMSACCFGENSNNLDITLSNKLIICYQIDETRWLRVARTESYFAEMKCTYSRCYLAIKNTHGLPR